MASNAVARPKRARPDPAPRHIDGSAVWANVDNRDPNREYVLVHRGNPELGIPYYESMGYRVEEYKGPAGVKLRAGQTCKEGEEISNRGMVLMSCTKQRKQEIARRGPDGQSGLDLADEHERRIIDRERGGIDGLRGMRDIRAGYFDVNNETSQLAVERE